MQDKNSKYVLILALMLVVIAVLAYFVGKKEAAGSRDAGAVVAATPATGAPSPAPAPTAAVAPAPVAQTAIAPPPVTPSVPSTGPNFDEPSVSGPSFDCAKASTFAERSICADPQLAAMEQELTARYTLARQDPRYSEAILQEQRAYLRSLSQCTDRACVEQRMGERMFVTAPYAQ